MRSKFLPFDILYEDRELILINKPVGLLTTHTHLLGRAAREAQPTAENFLNSYVRKGQLRSSKRVYLVHRLDRETSGVMMFVKSEQLAEAFRECWNELTEKTYLARVIGELVDKEGEFVSYLLDDPKTMKVRSVDDGQRGKLAHTLWRRIDDDRFFCSRDLNMPTTLVEVTLKSGRKNQIRVHFAEAGHAVVGDIKYGGPKADRLYLHSRRLAFIHPLTGKKFSFECEP